MENNGAGKEIIFFISAEQSSSFCPSLIGRKFLLKPAQLPTNQSSKPEDESNGKTSENGNATTFLINNPFLKCEKEEVEPPKQDENVKEPEKAEALPTDLFKPAKTNLFVQSSALSENSNFVFGQNLHERVVIVSVNTSLLMLASTSCLFHSFNF